VTDDLEAITRALANVSASGGIIHFPSPGSYAISSALRVSGRGITLRGDGMVSHACKDYGSSIHGLSVLNSSLIVLEHCTSCRIEHLGIHGSVNAPAATSGAQACEAEASALAAATRDRRQRRSSPTSQRPSTVPPAVRGHGYREPPELSAASSVVAAEKTPVPLGGAAIAIRGSSFQVTLSFLWITEVFAHVALSDFANTVTLSDMQISNAYGPCAICAAGWLPPPVGTSSGTSVGTPRPDATGGAAGGSSSRVDVLQITRLTANNYAGSNASVVWIDIGGGVNTVRLDNVGLINGGTGIRMHSPSVEPAGFYPGRPLFLLANDIEIDFPSGNAIELLRGEEVQISNGYVQGAGSTAIVDRRKNDSSLGVGLLVGTGFTSELMVSTSRFFGHALSAVELRGGTHATFSNNVIGENSIAAHGASSGFLVGENVSDFIVTSNHVGSVLSQGTQRYGIEIERGASDRYVISMNTLTGNLAGGLDDGGSGKAKAVESNVL
jgi:hypothetical protein